MYNNDGFRVFAISRWGSSCWLCFIPNHEPKNSLTKSNKYIHKLFFTYHLQTFPNQVESQNDQSKDINGTYVALGAG